MLQEGHLLIRQQLPGGDLHDLGVAIPAGGAEPQNMAAIAEPGLRWDGRWVGCHAPSGVQPRGLTMVSILVVRGWFRGSPRAIRAWCNWQARRGDVAQTDAVAEPVAAETQFPFIN